VIEGVRVRFAPSPTGHLHVGGARTALFNWLFARHHGGVFILRIEDTDTTRNRSEYTNAIYDGLRWLGLDWDEGPDRGGAFAPYLQSERAQRHLAVARDLLARGAAYECFCHLEPERADDTEDDDEVVAEAAVANHAPDSATNAANRPPNSGAHVGARLQSRTPPPKCLCASLDDEDRAERETSNPAIRFHVPRKRDFVVNDLVRGEVTFPNDMVEDFIIVTSDGRALYNLAATIDDHDMAITHVIRGEEHLANTPKQQLIYEALGWTAPKFAHIPIILNTQRRKLSKRDGATSLVEYQAMGYVPDAVVNFLALLGWSPGGNRELLSRAELIELFDLDRVVKHPAIFDTAKLGWLNKEYIKAMPVGELAARILAMIHTDRARVYRSLSPERVEQVAALLHDRVKTVVEILEQGAYFFTDAPIQPAEEALAKYCATPQALQRLRDVRESLAVADKFDAVGIEQTIRELAARAGVKAADFIHPLRVAVTGQSVSPGIFEVCAILGRDIVRRRIDALVKFLEAAGLPAAKVAH
jgi:glutamyl-tRNA synthetase